MAVVPELEGWPLTAIGDAEADVVGVVPLAAAEDLPTAAEEAGVFRVASLTSLNFSINCKKKTGLDQYLPFSNVHSANLIQFRF